MLRSNSYSDVSCPISAGKLVSCFSLRSNSYSDVSCPISGGKLVSCTRPKSNNLSELNCQISAGTGPVMSNHAETWSSTTQNSLKEVPSSDDGAIMSTLDFALFITSLQHQDVRGRAPRHPGFALPQARPPRMDAASLSTLFIRTFVIFSRRCPSTARRRLPVAAHAASRLRTLMRTPPRFPRANSCCTVE